MYRTPVLTIAAGQKASSAVKIDSGELPRFLIAPAAFTGATVTVEISADNGAAWMTLETLNGSAAALTLTVRAGRSAPSVIPLDPSVFTGLHMLRVVSAAAEAADRVLQLVVLI